MLTSSAGVLLAVAEGSGGVERGSEPLWAWLAFIAFIAALLLVDLKVVMRESHVIRTREAAIYSAVWIALGVAFTGLVWTWLGAAAAQEYITGYLIEKSLSVDNVFVWAVMFSFFAVPRKYQHRVLFWGIFGAIVFRLIFIFAGVALLESLSWIVYVFGAFLIYTAYKLFTNESVEVDPATNPVLVRIRRWLPQTENYHGEHFFVRVDGRRMVTPMLTVLVSIEFTDILFAVDSIPAILAITRDEFLVFSSNAFAILGLRALYFLFAGIQDRFIYLNRGLGIILGFVGVKFVVEGIGEQTGNEALHIPTWASLGFIAVVLALTFWLSWRHGPAEDAEAAPGHPQGGGVGDPHARADSAPGPGTAARDAGPPATDDTTAQARQPDADARARQRDR